VSGTGHRQEKKALLESPLIAIVIAITIEETTRGERAFDIYSRLLTERIIFLGTPIDDEITNLTIAELWPKGRLPWRGPTGSRC
jgi:hypothetical protein